MSHLSFLVANIARSSGVVSRLLQFCFRQKMLEYVVVVELHIDPHLEIP